MCPEVTIVIGRGVYEGVRCMMGGESIIMCWADHDKPHRYGVVIRWG